jgi:hypothetical protein
LFARVQTDKQAKALFQVFVSFEPKGLAFAPNEAAILEEINANTLEGIISVAQVLFAVRQGLAVTCSVHAGTWLMEINNERFRGSMCRRYLFMSPPVS